MAGANGPTSAGGTVDTPNPEGGATPPADTGKEGAERREKAKEKPSQDQNEDG